MHEHCVGLHFIERILIHSTLSPHWWQLETKRVALQGVIAFLEENMGVEVLFFNFFQLKCEKTG